MVEIQSVAVFSCEKGEDIDDPSLDPVGVLDSDDLDTPRIPQVRKLRPVHRGETSTHQTALAVNVDWYGSRRIIVGS
jgi:hypothetical protein